MRRATIMMRLVFATELPPYFCTTIGMRNDLPESGACECTGMSAGGAIGRAAAAGRRWGGDAADGADEAAFRRDAGASAAVARLWALPAKSCAMSAACGPRAPPR